MNRTDTEQQPKPQAPRPLDGAIGARTLQNAYVVAANATICNDACNAMWRELFILANLGRTPGKGIGR